MEPDCYLVEVIHYLNPHLIWIRNKSNGTLEQIGVYGVVPLDRELILETEVLETRRTNTWMQASTYVMMKVFMEATAVYFEPIHLHRRSSIFDSNIHKYGELLIQKQDGKRRKLSKYLTKAECALYDEAAFHEQLSLGNVQTKLSKIETDEVMKVITGKLKDEQSVVSLHEQTAVYQAAKKIEALTTENLNKHNRSLNKTISNKDILNVLDKKFKDLQLCKDIDEESQGRATKRNKTKSESGSGLLQKLKIRAKNNLAGYEDSHTKTEDKNSHYDMVSEQVDYQNYSSHNISNNLQSKMPLPREDCSVSREDETNQVFQPKRNYRKKTKSAANRPPEYDVKTQMRVAYSPPGVDKSKLVLKIVPIIQENDTKDTYKVTVENENDVLDIKDDMFGEVDSGVNIAITNADVLKKYHDNKTREDITQEATPTRQETVFLHEHDPTINKTMKTGARSISDVSSNGGSALKSKSLQRKLLLYKKHESSSSCYSTENFNKEQSSSSNSGKDGSSSTSNDASSTKKVESSSNTTTKLESDEEEVNELIEKYTASLKPHIVNKEEKHVPIDLVAKKNNVNPFHNLDPNVSVFVEKLVRPVLMVHTKNNCRIEPICDPSEIPFNNHVHNVLRNMNVDKAMTMQSVSWFSILRGYSTFLIGPQSCGKTMGYLPSVCRLISDFDNDIVNSVGPTCVIVAATAQSVSEIEYKCRMFLGTKETIFTSYAGMDLMKVTTSLLNGCNLFICTPCVLVKLLLQTEFGLDLRRLTTFVLDDCERLGQVYQNEIKIALVKIKQMLKCRVNKEVQVQFILASRMWCDFMEPLANATSNTVICIGAFQECVLYSKAKTTVDLLKPENKIAKVLEFLENIDKRKKTVIACRTDKEVVELENILIKKYDVVYACNSGMTVEDLRSLNMTWNDYADPFVGPILVCCDSNLSHMNITNAHHLLHYSMPEMFSSFCKRFSVLNDNYPSIFRTENETVAIKIILEDTNAVQLPKICNFIKRCTKEFPKDLDAICNEIMTRKDMVKAQNLVPLCGNLLALGECPDYWYCKERHTSFKIHDQPKEWIPTDGIITFRILHYQSAVTYSIRLLSHLKKGNTRKYPQTYSTLSVKMGIYFSQENNRKLLGVPKIGDVCAVSINQDFYVRCQVVNITDRYRNGLPKHVLIKLIDEEKLEIAQDIYLYHLPKEFREIETYVAQVSLAGVLPKDKDITFSNLAKHHIKKDVEKNESLYMRGKVVLTVGNRIFVDNIDVCQDLTSMKEVVVKNNFKDLLGPHCEPFPNHITKLKSRLFPDEIVLSTHGSSTDFEKVEEVTVNTVKEPPKVQWAHLNREDLTLVYFTSALDPSTFFVRLAKFADTIESVCKDIDKHMESNPEPLSEVKEKDIVLARFPDNQSYERARIDAIDETRAKCFFVDYGDWREVPVKHLTEIPEKFIHRLPFQAIECRLMGVKPVGDDWTDFSTNWLCDRCDVEDGENLKGLYVQYFSTDKAQYTGGNKYAVALIDTNSGTDDIVYNTVMIDLNLAAPDENEIDILNKMSFKSLEEKGDVSDDEDWTVTQNNAESVKIPNKLLRSVPLIADDEDDSDRWSVNFSNEFVGPFKTDKPSLEMFKTKSETSSVASSTKIENDPATNEYEVIKKLKIKELDSDDLSSAETTSMTDTSDVIKEVNEGRKPNLLWRQNKTCVTIKIMLIGAEAYELVIRERELQFSAEKYDSVYKFKINLYGIVDKNKSTHAYKGQYILVKLIKIMHKNWLNLTKAAAIAKWIVYDHDSIDTSSDEEDPVDDTLAKVIKNYHKEESESDDDFCDDVNYNYPS